MKNVSEKLFALLCGIIASFLFFLVACILAPAMNWEKIVIEYAILGTVVLLVTTFYSFSQQKRVN